MFKKFLMALLMTITYIAAEIREIDEISPMEKYVTTDSLVLFNVTSTLYEPASTLANNRWRVYFTERVKQLSSNDEAAEKLINKVKGDIVRYLPKKAVEESTPLFIANLQNQRIPALGITRKEMTTPYAADFGLITSKHLLSVGINLEHTLSYLDVNDGYNDNHSFAFGLIFTNGKSVGPALTSFLRRLEHKPAKIIMIDNSRKSLEEAEAVLRETGIAFAGFRYGRCDKTHFDLILGHIQFFAFINEGRALSDAEALKVKEAHHELNYGALLDGFILELL